MIIKKFENEEQWLEDRKGRITGTRLKDIASRRTSKPKIGFYEIIAERIAIPPNGENVMDRGHRLEDDALQRFAKETGKKINTDKVIWFREDDENIAISPDGSVVPTKKGIITEAIECKCLSSARHIEAWITQEIPDDYEYQVLQYFIVNDDLKKLYFTFYDPRMPKDFFYITVTRESKQQEVEEYLKLERDVLNKINELEQELTF